MPKFIAYYRVSTECQGESGLGLAAQREAVSRFLGARRGFPSLLAECTEVESGSALRTARAAAGHRAEPPAEGHAGGRQAGSARPATCYGPDFVEKTRSRAAVEMTV